MTEFLSLNREKVKLPQGWSPKWVSGELLLSRHLLVLLDVSLTAIADEF